MPKAKLEKKVTIKKNAVKVVKKPTGLSVPVYSLAGLKSGTMTLPKEIFGAKINKPLLLQAIRVYQNNLTAHFGNIKTRGEVKGSTRKIRVQKGTGGARHGGIRAPIFVGGGIAMGPKYRKITLDLPQKMKKAALVSALSDKMAENEIMGATGLDKATGKTKQLAVFFKKLNKKDILVVVDGKNDKLERAAGNLPGIKLISAGQINAYNVLAHQALILTKEAVKNLASRI